MALELHRFYTIHSTYLIYSSKDDLSVCSLLITKNVAYVQSWQCYQLPKLGTQNNKKEFSQLRKDISLLLSAVLLQIYMWLRQSTGTVLAKCGLKFFFVMSIVPVISHCTF